MVVRALHRRAPTLWRRAPESVRSSTPPVEHCEEVVEVVRSPPDPTIAPIRATDHCDRNSPQHVNRLQGTRGFVAHRERLEEKSKKKARGGKVGAIKNHRSGPRSLPFLSMKAASIGSRRAFSRFQCPFRSSSNIVSHYRICHMHIAAQLHFAVSIAAKKAAMERAIARARKNQPK